MQESLGGGIGCNTLFLLFTLKGVVDKNDECLSLLLTLIPRNATKALHLGFHECNYFERNMEMV